MNAQVNYHPEEEILQQFVRGELSTGFSVGVSAHLQMCAACREKADELQALTAATWSDPAAADHPAAPAEANFEALVSEIVKLEQVKDLPAQSETELRIEMIEEAINLPPVLAAAVKEQGLAWAQSPGGVQEANVYLDDETQCEFIYMAPGCKTPQHTHAGKEITLVLHGSFSDEYGQYGPADFTLRDPSHSHMSETDEGCLCFAVLDRPLKFTKGLARLMNLYNRYKFKKGVYKPA